MAGKIIATIDPRGSVLIKTEGYSGPSCLLATRKIEELLGVRGPERLTEEYFENEQQSEHLSEGQ